MRLHDKLSTLDKYPFHMPGHKRNAKFGITGSEIDITEIDGFDNLHAPCGVIADIESRLKGIYKSKRSFISVNGSTAGILAGIHAVCNKGDTVIVAKNCHKSVFNACMLLELKIRYIEPEFDYTNGYYTSISQRTVDEALKDVENARALIITSPTYEGFISRIKCDIPIITDAAHGAHLGLGYFPEYPKSDIVISSLHKTLPSLTQTAVVNVYNEKYINCVKRYMDIFQTTSPSYVLMNSIDLCCEYIENNPLDFGFFYERLCDLRLVETNNLRIQYTDDISKIVLSCANTDISGVELAEKFRKEYNIEPEYASERYVLFMATVGDTQEGLNALKSAIEKIDEELLSTYCEILKKPPVTSDITQICISNEYEACNLSDSIGKISNEFVFAYPPGIPIIAPNEVISRNVVEYISLADKKGVNILSDSGEVPNKILTKKVL